MGGTDNRLRRIFDEDAELYDRVRPGYPAPLFDDLTRAGVAPGSRILQYLDLLGSYSGHRALTAEARAGLRACLAALIDERHGGTVVKRYLTELRVASAR